MSYPSPLSSPSVVWSSLLPPPTKSLSLVSHPSSSRVVGCRRRLVFPPPSPSPSSSVGHLFSSLPIYQLSLSVGRLSFSRVVVVVARSVTLPSESSSSFGRPSSSLPSSSSSIGRLFSYHVVVVGWSPHLLPSGRCRSVAPPHPFPCRRRQSAVSSPPLSSSSSVGRSSSSSPVVVVTGQPFFLLSRDVVVVGQSSLHVQVIIMVGDR